jgi:Phage tail assembly chaperone proteins, E, or 41 or 14
MKDKLMTDAAALESAPAASFPFIEAAKRFRKIPLDWPVTAGGKEYHEISLCRLTAAEVASFQDTLQGLPDDAKIKWPVYRDADGSALPEGLLDALDDDDLLRIDEAVIDFLPRRFRAAPVAATALANGAAIDNSSAA